MRVVKFSLAAGLLSTVFLGIVLANAVLAPMPENPGNRGLDDDRLQEHLLKRGRRLVPGIG